MKVIKITKRIDVWSLGDGWRNNYTAATALAKYTSEIWRQDLKDFAEETDIEIDIDVAKDGIGKDCCIDIIGPENENDFDLIEQVECLLTDESEIWANFCSPEVSEKLWTQR